MSKCTKCGICTDICTDIDLEQKEEELELNIGTILIATGAESYEPSPGEFGYREIPGVITLQMFRRLIDQNGDKHSGRQGNQ